MEQVTPGLKVMLLFSSGHLGGAERSLTRMAMLGGEVEYRFATLGAEGPWSSWVRERGFTPIVLGRQEGGLSAFLTALFRLFLYLQKNPCDVVYVCGSRAAFVIRWFRWLGCRFRLVHGVRWNPDSNSLLDRFTRMTERYLRGAVDGWIANSQAAKTTLVQRCKVDATRVAVIYNGIDSVPAHPLPISQRPKEVVTVANLNPRKGHIPFLAVIRQVLERVPGVRFVFVGRDDMAGQVQDTLRAQQLDASISCTGFQADPSHWLERARVFVLPSLWGEGCPTSILEAFSHAVPVVAYAIDGIPELVENGVSGHVIPPGQTGQMVDCVVKLLADVTLAQRQGDAGRQRVVDSFSMTSCARQHDLFFLSLVRTGH